MHHMLVGSDHLGCQYITMAINIVPTAGGGGGGGGGGGDQGFPHVYKCISTVMSFS